MKEKSIDSSFKIIDKVLAHEKDNRIKIKETMYKPIVKKDKSFIRKMVRMFRIKAIVENIVYF